jgi:hypothetical protein
MMAYRSITPVLEPGCLSGECSLFGGTAMKKIVSLSALAVLGIAVSQSSAAYISNTVATFDPAGGGTVGVLATGVSKSIASWKTDVAAAHAADLGGVYNGSSTTNGGNIAGPAVADTGAVTVDQNFSSSDPALLNFGAGLAKQVRFSPSVTTRSAAFTSVQPTSGGRAMAFADNTQDATVILSLLNAPNDRLTEIAFALNTRTQTLGNVTITATFSGGGTAVASSTSAQNSGDTNPHVFYHFAAPTGESISSFRYQSTTFRVSPFDDFSFIVTPIPEPAALSTLAAIGGLILRRRTV